MSEDFDTFRDHFLSNYQSTVADIACANRQRAADEHLNSRWPATLATGDLIDAVCGIRDQLVEPMPSEVVREQ
jgi:hypothetical protein